MGGEELTGPEALAIEATRREDREKGRRTEQKADGGGQQRR